MLPFRWIFLLLLIGSVKPEYIMQQAINAFGEFHRVKCHILLFTYSNKFNEQRVLLDFYKAVIKNEYKPTVLESINNENRKNSSISTRKGCSKPLRSFIMGSVSHIAEYMIAEKRREDIRKDVWLLFVANDFEQELFLSQIELSIGSEVYLARQKNNGFEFWEIYQPAKNNPIRKIFYGDWNADTGLKATELSIFERRRDFGGAVLRTAKFELDQLNHLQDEAHVRLLSDIATMLKKELNFTSTTLSINLNNSDYQRPENPQNVIIRMLARKEVDLSLLGLFVDSASLNIIDYSGPVARTHYRIYIKKQSVGFDSGLHFSNPLPNTAWYIVILTVMITPMIISFMYYISYKARLIIRNQHSFLDLCVTIYQMLCLQGGASHRELYSISLMFVFFNLWAFLIRTIYSASLASSLAIEVYIPPLNSLEELFKDGQYEFGVKKYSMAREIYGTRIPYLKNLNTALMERNIANLPDTYIEGLQRVCSRKKYAFMANRIEVSKLKSNIPCKIDYLPNEEYTFSTAYAMTKHNDYLPFINHWLHVFNQVGVMEKLRYHTSGKELLTLEDSSQSLTSLTLQDTLFLQMIIFLGIVLSVLILFAELIHRRIRRNRRTSYR